VTFYVFWLSVVDIFFSGKLLVTGILDELTDFSQYESGDSVNSDICFTMGFVGQWAGQATITWNFMIALRLFATFVKGGVSNVSLDPNLPKMFSNRTWYDYLLQSFAWIYPSVNAALLVYFHQYGPSSNGCWIVNTPMSLYRLIFYIIPLFSYLFLSVCILVFILVKLKTIRSAPHLHMQNRKQYITREQKFTIQLTKYTVIFVVLWTGPLIHRAREYFGFDYIPVFDAIDVISVAMQACANSVVWATSPQFIRVYRYHIDEERTHILPQPQNVKG